QSPIIIDILPGPAGLRVETHKLIGAGMREKSTFDDLLANPQSTIERIDEFLDRIEEILAAFRPEGPISIDAINLAHQCYFTLSERTRALRHTSGRLAQQIEAALRKSTRITSTSLRPPQMRDPLIYNRLDRRFCEEILAAEDINAYLRETTI